MHRLRRVARGNVALFGDASGGVDAITGEGLRLAFAQAAALAGALAAGDLSRYERAHRHLAKRPFRIGMLTLELAKRQALRRQVMKALGTNPDLFARLLAIHAGQTTSRDTFVAGARLGWQILAA
jgi:flavin-dependent dehydrogenase